MYIRSTQLEMGLMCGLKYKFAVIEKIFRPDWINIETRLPKAAPKQWPLTTFQGIRENDTIRIEKPAQQQLFEGKQ